MKPIFKEPIYRVKSIGFRLNDEELNNLQALCVSQKLTMSEAIRIALNDYAAKVKRNHLAQ